jgi:hypothetical protein
MTSFFRFVNKRASYSFGIISLAQALVNVTDFSIGRINCKSNRKEKMTNVDLEMSNLLNFILPAYLKKKLEYYINKINHENL